MKYVKHPALKIGDGYMNPRQQSGGVLGRFKNLITVAIAKAGQIPVSMKSVGDDIRPGGYELLSRPSSERPFTPPMACKWARVRPPAPADPSHDGHGVCRRRRGRGFPCFSLPQRIRPSPRRHKS